MASGKKKNFVLDTNVVLHDFHCLENFENNDVYIPITVLEELDKFKKGNEQINYNAREFLRQLDELTDDHLFTKGAELGGGRGRLYVALCPKYPARMEEVFPERIPDHRILATAMEVADKNAKTKTILVTKDINLRMKARSLGVPVEDYINDKVANVSLFEKKHERFENTDPALIDKIHSSPDGLDLKDFAFDGVVNPNDCLVLRSAHNSALVRYDSFSKKIVKVDKQVCSGIQARNAEQAFALEVLTNPEIKLVAITGKAGTGKTLLALAAALKQHEVYERVLLARPIVALANKDLGFLPGDEQQKIAPYMQPLFDNLTVIKSQLAYGSTEYRNIEEMEKSKKLEIEALAYIRGRSLSDMFCIVDEAQNLTPHEVKTIVTRAGEGTKMVFTGDLQQIDSPYLDSQSNGLAYIIDRMTGQDLFAHVNLTKGERSELSELASNLL